MNWEEFHKKYDRDFAIKEAKELINTNSDLVIEAEDRIERVMETKIEEIAKELNESVIIGKEVWECLIYASLSPYSPQLVVNGRVIRKNLHTLMVGEIATSKSQILKLLEKISPKALTITNSTQASLVGVGTKEGIDEGVLDQANDGIITIPEFEHIHKDFQILRDAMDCDEITLYKGGHKKSLDVNISYVGGANPNGDFYINGTNLREQLKFRERILSRFDVLLPLTTTVEKMEDILGDMEVFGGSVLDIEGYKDTLSDLSDGLWDWDKKKPKFEGITLSNKQISRLKSTFIDRNKNLSNGTPLLTLRAFETLLRLVNTVTATRFYDREVKDEEIVAEEEDIGKAIELWEELVNYREELYESEDRRISSIEDLILMGLYQNGGSMNMKEIKNFVKSRTSVTNRTIERKIMNIIESGEANRYGERNGTVELKGD